ncbi:MAG: PepSY domain-containing protein [Gammaproteobacteria bacterium]
MDEMKKRLPFFLLAFILVGYLAPSFADRDQEDARRLLNSGEIVPLETILNRARKTHPGQILEVELEEKRGRLIYEIEMLDDQGTVWELRFDARSADLLKLERED